MSEGGAGVATMSSTDRWLAAAPDGLPRLAGAAATAERLLLLLHYGIDWDSWVGRGRRLYWTHHLPNRVRVATYVGGSDLDQWWAVVSRSLESDPSNPEQRLELARLLREPAAPVLDLLRSRSVALVLRTRIVAEAVAAGRVASGAGRRR